MNPTHSVLQYDLPIIYNRKEYPEVTKPQLVNILLELKAGKKLTGCDALRLGIAGSAFARRIKDLKDIHGVDIKTERVQIGNASMSQYSLPKKD